MFSNSNSILLFADFLWLQTTLFVLADEYDEEFEKLSLKDICEESKDDDCRLGD